jgi:hypothetical protein
MQVLKTVDRDFHLYLADGSAMVYDYRNSSPGDEEDKLSFGVRFSSLYKLRLPLCSGQPRIAYGGQRFG